MKHAWKIVILSGILSLGVDGAFAAVVYYHPDHLGSAMTMTNEYAAITEAVLYTPFGEVSHKSVPEETASVPFRFTDQELDSASELYNYGARYYDSILTVLLSQDPLLQGSLPEIYLLQPARWNGYSYALGNPIRHIDIEGKLVAGAVPQMPAAFSTLLDGPYLDLFKGQSLVTVTTKDFVVHGGNNVAVSVNDVVGVPVGGTFQLQRGNEWKVQGKTYGVHTSPISSDSGGQKIEAKGVKGSSAVARLTDEVRYHDFTVLATSLPEGPKVVGFIILGPTKDAPFASGMTLNAKVLGFEKETRGLASIAVRNKQGVWYTLTRTDAPNVPLMIQGEWVGSRSDWGPDRLEKRANALEEIGPLIQDALKEWGVPLDAVASLKGSRLVEK